MRIRNTDTRYGLVAKLFHWLMALLLIALIVNGLWMVEMPVSLQKLKWYGWHKEWGMLALLLVGLRLLWRLTQSVPSLPGEISHAQKIAAYSVHWLFYGLMIFLPITGWMVSSSAGLPVSFFGWFVLPDLISADKQLMKTLILIHKYLAYFLIGILCLHVAAALWHHFVLKDSVLKRMVS